LIHCLAFRAGDRHEALHLGVLRDLFGEENLHCRFDVGGGHGLLVRAGKEATTLLAQPFHDIVHHSVNDVNCVWVDLHVRVNCFKDLKDKAMVPAVFFPLDFFTLFLFCVFAVFLHFLLAALGEDRISLVQIEVRIDVVHLVVCCLVEVTHIFCFN